MDPSVGTDLARQSGDSFSGAVSASAPPAQPSDVSQESRGMVSAEPRDSPFPPQPPFPSELKEPGEQSGQFQAHAFKPPDFQAPESPSGKEKKPTFHSKPGVYWLERRLVRNVLERVGRPPVAVVLPNGEQIQVSPDAPKIRIFFHDRGAVWLTALDPELYFGDCYMDGRVEVEGDLGQLLETVFRRIAVEGKKPSGWWIRLMNRLRRTASNTLDRSRRNAAHHYDLGDAFYELWLDKELLYTCAYFPRPDLSLEEAQQAKMEHICRKVWLRPGERVVEAGCGWGALALYMARRYGVTVQAYNISRNQIAYARRRAQAEGLADRVQFIEDDYRNIRGEFDVFVSIGMLEHVGRDHYHTLGQVIDRCLKPEGRGILHSIGRDRPIESDRWIHRRIFPGAYAPSLREMLEVLQPYGFSVQDVENLRLHYALTLQHWLDRFEQAREEAARMFDERFVRMWRLYLTGARTAFIAGTLQLFQIVFTRTGRNAYPWTRAGLYGQEVPANPYAPLPDPKK